MKRKNTITIDQITLYKIRLPYQRPFVTSRWRQEANESIIVRIDAEGLTGWGEVPVITTPYYSAETSNSAWLFLQDQLVPLLVKKRSICIETIEYSCDQFIGNALAKSGVVNACLDLFAQQEGLSLASFLGGYQTEVPVGLSLGVTGDVAEVIERINQALALGYRRVKLKIKPGKDIEYLRQVREEFPDLCLQVDANMAYAIEDVDTLTQLDQFDLHMIEQPFPARDWRSTQALQQKLQTPICLDESIQENADIETMALLDAGRIANIKVARVGGLLNGVSMIQCAKEKSIACWVGGMLETGIGRAANLALASFLDNRIAHDISASERYFARDIIESFVVEDGYMSVSDGVGLGVVVDEEFLLSVTERKLVVR